MIDDTDTYTNDYTPTRDAQDQINKIIATDKARRTWSQYEAIRKQDPAMYMSPKVQAAMHADALALGDAFTDGNF